MGFLSGLQKLHTNYLKNKELGNGLDPFNPSNDEKNWMQSVNDKVKQYQNSNTTTFGMITDTHIDLNGTQATKRALRHVQAISYYADTYGLDFILNNGDLEDGNKPKADSIVDVQAGIEAHQLTKVPFIVTQGNHDDNSGYSRDQDNRSFAAIINDQDAYPIRLSQYNQWLKTNPNDPTNPYGYYVANDNLVVIVLNSYDVPYISRGLTSVYISHGRSEFRQAQIDWFINTLQSVPNDKQVLIESHSSLRGIWKDENHANFQHAGNVIVGIIEAFQQATSYTGGGFGPNKKDVRGNPIAPLPENDPNYKVKVSVDFSDKPSGRVIAVMSGHAHVDRDVKFNDVLYIESLCSAYDRGAVHGRQIGKENEDAWDVITVDHSKRTMAMIRYGAGSDRLFNY